MIKRELVRFAIFCVLFLACIGLWSLILVAQPTWGFSLRNPPLFLGLLFVVGTLCLVASYFLRDQLLK